MKYRSEIDGLRALAVVPVILFHAGYGAFEGGYLGVDVFFVISGYLITSILIEDLTKKRFSLLTFYERRARRILPALVFICLLCIPFAALLMVPGQFADFGRALASIALFVSNFRFWRESGYFGDEAERNPLIHTWSLAVEEQFYVVFPIMLLVLWQFGLRVVVIAVSLCAAVSLGLSQWAAENKPLANFFLTPTRVWELFAGSLCAIALHRRTFKPNETLSVVGLFLIVSAMAVFDAATPVPSFWAVWPIAGVCLIILFCGRTTFAGRLLSLRPVVFVGLVSYSAYLWHQPIFAFLRLYDPDPSAMAMAFATVSVLPLAALTWRYIEQPFRVGSAVARRSFGRTAIFSGAVASLLFVFLSGQFIHSRACCALSDSDFHEA